MWWLITALFSYFLLGIVQVVDKYLLKNRIPHPKLYVFYIGILGMVGFLFAPFGFLKKPDLVVFWVAFFAGVFHILGLFWFYKGVKMFDVSIQAPVVGGLVALFTFGLSAFFKKTQPLGFFEIVSFFLLLIGSFLITFKRKRSFSFESLKFASFSALFLAMFFVLMKILYLKHPFFSSILWSRIGAFGASVGFLVFKEVRRDILGGFKITKEKTWTILLPNQIVSALALILQNFAIKLAPFSYLGIVQALSGVQYVFLFLATLFLSFKFPQILKEEVSKKIIFQKVVSIILISIGIFFLTL